MKIFPCFIAQYKYLLSLFGIILIAAACQKKSSEEIKPVSDISADIANKWMALFLNIERFATGYRPPVAARAFAYTNLAAYEVIVPNSVNYRSVAPNFKGLNIPKIEAGKPYNYEAAVNEAYYLMMKSFFPHISESYLIAIDNLYRQFDNRNIDADVLARSKQFGKAVATAVFDFSKTDVAGHEAYLRNQPADYAAPVGIGKWQPTFPDFGKALLPYWGKVRTFAINETEKVAKLPVAYSTRSTAPFYAQGLEVYSTTTTLTSEQKWIAEFWSDDIFKLTFEPAARWIAIAKQVVEKEKVPLEKAIYTYTKVSLSLSDVGVACWNSKYIYNVERPVSYIRTTIDPKWVSKLNNVVAVPYIAGVTPPFPAYPSGHSAFGGAAAEALSDIYGYNYAMTDNCHQGRTEFLGMPRSFNSFYDMAYENAYSRIPLGVHYRMDCEEGLRMGFATGKKVNQLNWKK
ncbi:vanadium-dependent haloperoxidase [Emticicia aquatilis]|nr:vanadium-dependent haloperoxidase [Emticicia aquatilis]